jgi:transposase-like protein
MSKEVDRMAKARYNYWLSADGLTRLEAYARDGLTDKQIAANMKIAPKTLYVWMKAHSRIKVALERGKEIVDVEVENSLLHNALGFKETVQKPIKLKTVTYKNGKRVKEEERIEYADEEVFCPPETRAQMFWLKNRKPAVWRDTAQLELGNKDEKPFKNETSVDLSKLSLEEKKELLKLVGKANGNEIAN